MAKLWTVSFSLPACPPPPLFRRCRRWFTLQASERGNGEEPAAGAADRRASASEGGGAAVEPGWEQAPRGRPHFGEVARALRVSVSSSGLERGGAGISSPPPRRSQLQQGRYFVSIPRDPARAPRPPAPPSPSRCAGRAGWTPRELLSSKAAECSRAENAAPRLPALPGKASFSFRLPPKRGLAADTRAFRLGKAGDPDSPSPISCPGRKCNSALKSASPTG